MNTRLVPSFLRTARHFAVLCSLVVLAWVAWSAYSGRPLGLLEVLEPWLVGVVALPIAAWFMFVPLRLEYSDTDLTIEHVFGRRHKLPWTQLTHYGSGHGVFMIQFNRRQAFQIFGHAYRKDDWQQFIDFLEDRFPGQQTSWWIGPFGLK